MLELIQRSGCWFAPAGLVSHSHCASPACIAPAELPLPSVALQVAVFQEALLEQLHLSDVVVEGLLVVDSLHLSPERDGAVTANHPLRQCALNMTNKTSISERK